MAVEIGGAPVVTPVSIETDGENLIIKARFLPEPRLTESKRSFLIATGNKVMAPFTVNGKPLNVSFNATISAK